MCYILFLAFPYEPGRIASPYLPCGNIACDDTPCCKYSSIPYVDRIDYQCVHSYENLVSYVNSAKIHAVIIRIEEMSDDSCP